MIVIVLALQASVAAISEEGRKEYEPFRKCLLERADLLATAVKADGAILEQARSKCFAANLSSGSAAMFAEMKAGASQDQAVERVAAFREQVEQEALARIRSVKSKGENVAQD